MTEAVVPPPLYDLFIDVPHPTSVHAPKVVLPADNQYNEVAEFLNTPEGIREVSCFCFPEYTDAPKPTPGLTRYDVYSYQFVAKDYCFVMKNKETVIYGHCWRYQPIHSNVKSREDVGRRAPRAFCVLSRHSAQRFWEDVFGALESVVKMRRGHLVERILQELYVQYQNRPRVVGNFVEEIKANTFKIQGLEYGTASNNFYFGPKPVTTIFPLLRALSLENALRLWSALLCERRVILVSKSVERLTVCSMGAMQMLQPLQWACPNIPLLPFSKIQALHYPGPYCMGVLGGDDVTEGINRMNLPSTLLVNLDYNSLTILNHDGSTEFIPDLLFISNINQEDRRPTSVEILARELSETIRIDKSQFAATNQMSSIARDAKVAEAKVREGISKLKKFGTKLRDRMKGSGIDDSFGAEDDSGDPSPAVSQHNSNVEQEFIPDSQVLYVNPRGELAIFRAFLTFYVGFLGNPRSYLTRDASGKVIISKEGFLTRRTQVEGREAVGILSMVQYFLETQLFSQFTLEQIARYSRESNFTGLSTTFHDAVKSIAARKEDFNGFNCRNAAAEVLNKSILEFETSHLEKIRSRASDITSNQVRLEADYETGMIEFVLYMRNFDFVLPCFMEVIESRLSDCRGLQYKHGILGLKLLQISLIHGSLSLLPRVHRLLHLIAPLKHYTNNMPINIKQYVAAIRSLAREVQATILDWGLLMTKRNHVRNMPSHPTVRETRLQLRTPFAQIHNFIGSTINGKVVPQPAWQGNAAAPVNTDHDLLSYSLPQADDYVSGERNEAVNELTHSFAKTTIEQSSKTPAGNLTSSNPFVGVQVQPNSRPTPQNASSHQPIGALAYSNHSYPSGSVPSFSQPTIVSVPPSQTVNQHNSMLQFGSIGQSLSTSMPNQQQLLQPQRVQYQNANPLQPSTLQQQVVQQVAQPSYALGRSQQPVQNQKRSNISMFDPLA